MNRVHRNISSSTTSLPLSLGFGIQEAILMNPKLQKEIQGIIEETDRITISQLAEEIDVTETWLKDRLNTSSFFQFGERLSRNPYSHIVQIKSLELDGGEIYLGDKRIGEHGEILTHYEKEDIEDDGFTPPDEGEIWIHYIDTTHHYEEDIVVEEENKEQYIREKVREKRGKIE